MNVLFCTTIFDQAITGAGRFAQCVADLGQFGLPCRVSVLSEQTQTGSTGTGNQFHLKLSRLSRYPVISYYFKSRDYASEINNIRAHTNIDVVFFNDAWLAYHFLQSKYAIPVAVFVHDDNAMHPWENVFGAVPAMLLRRKMERRALQKTTIALTNSGYMHSRLLEAYGVTPQRIQELSLAFVDYTDLPFKFQKIKIDKPIRVLFMKNDIRRGGLLLLAEALSRLSQFQFELTVVGPEPAIVNRALRPYLHHYPHLNLDIRGGIQAHGEIFALMERQHIFCVPAAREAFGVSYLEALAAGVRVIYHHTGGIPAELMHYGFALKERTAKDLEDLLCKVIEEDTPATEQLIMQGRKWVESKFSRSGMNELLCQLLSELTSSTSKPNFRTA